MTRLHCGCGRINYLQPAQLCYHDKSQLAPIEVQTTNYKDELCLQSTVKLEL